MSSLIEFYPTIDVSPEYSPKPAADFMPEWYKRLSPEPEKDVITAKACRPLLDSFCTGYIIPFPCSVKFICYKEDNELQIDMLTEGGVFSDDLSNEKFQFISWHNKIQLDGHPYYEKTPEGEYRDHPFKFLNPWIVKTPTNYSSIFTNPFNQSFGAFSLATGVVETDKYCNGVDLPAFFHIKEGEYIFEAGTPMVQIVPFARETWEHKVTKLHNNFSIRNLYKKTRKHFSVEGPGAKVYAKNHWVKKSYK